MTKFEETMNRFNEKLGNGVDNIIMLATVANETSSSGMPVPSVRNVDAIYEDGVFYVLTNSLSNKIKHIQANPIVSISLNYKNFTSIGKAYNLGWILDPKNASIRDKMRIAFAKWYDQVIDESNQNNIILAIKLIKGTQRIGYGTKYVYYDFANQAIEEVECE